MEQSKNIVPAESRALDPPAQRSAAEEAAYWQGYHAALGAAAEAASAAPPPRRLRVDGFTGARQAIFLEAVAAGFTTTEAAAKAEISLTAIYNFRNRRAGRAFNIAWEAADRRARRPLADHLRNRALEGQAETLRDPDGAVVGTRHRHDNRLAMAILTRLDRKAEASQQDERLVGAVAEEFEELLALIETGGDAEAFIEERRPPERPLTEAEQLERRYAGIAPADIPVSDLTFAGRRDWTADQLYRARKARFFERYWEEHWKPGIEPDEDDRPLPEAYLRQLRG